MEQIKSSTKFCHVTNIDNARNILSTSSFFLSRFDTMNDLDEKALHDKEEGDAFILCFCNSEALNIPVFYLYGGIDGKGCRIQITDKKLTSILKNCKVYGVNKYNKRLKKEISCSEYEILADWVYYASHDGYYEHHKGVVNKESSFEAVFEKLKEDGKHYFIKNLIWKYEKEFRVVVKFDRKIEYSRIALAFDIKDKERGINVVLGPETTKTEFLETKEEFEQYGIVNTNTVSGGYHISMNLVNRNRKLLR